MLKRQDSLLSASRRLQATATPPPEAHHVKSVGCMSGIFHLLSKYQNPNKRLTFGKRQEKRKPRSSPKPISYHPKQNNVGSKNTVTTTSAEVDRRPRSPTLPPELRRSTAVDTQPQAESPRTPPPSSIVKRLMGLDEDTPPKRYDVKEAVDGSNNSDKEKRQKLLQALEKCNDDLEGLKRLIMALQSANVAAKRVSTGGGSTTVVRPPCRDDDDVVQPQTNSATASNTGSKSIVQQQQQRKKPGEDDELAVDKLININPTLLLTNNYPSLSSLVRRSTARRCSRALAQTVEEVCKDIAWGEKREIGRIGLALQDYLWKELIEEVVKDLEERKSRYRMRIYCPPSRAVLPFEACKRRLRF